MARQPVHTGPKPGERLRVRGALRLRKGVLPSGAFGQAARQFRSCAQQVFRRNQNNVALPVAAGLCQQSPTVPGNNLSLAGEAGEECGDIGARTPLQGNVPVHENHAMFRNILLDGAVAILGISTRFLGGSFDGALILFGNNTAMDHDDDDDD